MHVLIGCLYFEYDFIINNHQVRYASSELVSGASIPMGQGDTSPQYLDWRGHYHECPLNISRVISATFYPCNIFLIS